MFVYITSYNQTKEPTMTKTSDPTTFDFGYGEVPSHRHVNPDGSEGGWVAETHAPNVKMTDEEVVNATTFKAVSKYL
jgi:hypothetical protein